MRLRSWHRASQTELQSYHVRQRHQDRGFLRSLQKKKKNYYIFSSQLRADQMPGPPREVQLTNDFFLDSHHHV